MMPSRSTSSSAILDYFRYAQQIPDFSVKNLKEPNGFFRFGESVVCYGRTTGTTRPEVNGDLFDASGDVQVKENQIFIPFDLNQVLDNLRYERYVQGSQPRWMEKSRVMEMYYRLRPLLPTYFRQKLQRIYLRDWEDIQFPTWPVDRSADILIERLLALAMRTLETDRLPFIWFWPHGHAACAILTHDVENLPGRDFCGKLMDFDDSVGIKSSFEIVPEKRYGVSSGYLDSIRDRGFEINIHGLDHEGNLFQDRAAFLEAAKKINRYAELFGSRGFRSPVLYRNVEWFQDLNFSYDMSIPNVARLEAQRGGCCTTMPYFLPGGVLELPLTTTEDYTLFHILKDHSTQLWKQQIETILKGNGLISFIIHPDYILDAHAQKTYNTLLNDLARLRSDRGVWLPLPGEVDRWWRERSQMKLVPSGKEWKISGPGSERARVAYARLDGDRLVYEIPTPVSEG